MADQWVTLLIQVPLVGVFVWYSLRMAEYQKESQREFLCALDKRDTAFENRTAALIEKMDANNRAVLETLGRMEHDSAEHDRFVRERFRIQSLVEPENK